MLIKILSNLPLKSKISRKIHKSRSDLFSYCKENNINPISIRKAEEYKKSDTLCVLASGKSINDINKETWDFINNNDSLLLNNSILHSHIPTYVFYETDSIEEDKEWLNKIKIENIRARANDYKNALIIWHFQNKRYFDFEKIRQCGIDNHVMMASQSLPGDTIEDFNRALEKTNKKGLNRQLDVSLYRRGSLARIIHFAVAMNYKEVIFYGADLNGTEYFFDSYTDLQLPIGCAKPNLNDYTYRTNSGKKQQNAIHMTIDPSVHPITMIDVINSMNIYWLKPNGINLYVANKDSALASILEVHSI